MGDGIATPPQAAPRRGSDSHSAPRNAGASGTGGISGGAGQCAAFRTPANDGIYIDQDAFTGIGGAGASLAGTCKRCGWDSRGEMCQTLVASVPTIGNPNYYPCLDLSLEFTSCLDVESCVCGGKVPARCAAIKAKQDACWGDAADGGTDTWESWVTVSTRCHFRFQSPANYHDMPVQGTDSCVLQFTASDCEFFADYGAFSGAVSKDPSFQDYRDGVTMIDGRNATLATYTTVDPTRYVAAIHVSQVSQASPGTKLTLVAECRSGQGQTDAQRLFGTIHFD